ncbi:MAG: hypothetical protein Q4G64_10040, partial [bacterium]|nr:hypothetical protein [bacterium]
APQDEAAAEAASVEDSVPQGMAGDSHEPPRVGGGGVLATAKNVAGGVVGAISGLVNKVRGKDSAGETKVEGSSFTMTTPEEAARQIIEGIEKGSYRVVIGRDANGLDKFSRLNPKGATEMIAKKMAELRS